MFKRLVSGMMAVALFLSFSVTALAMDNKAAGQVTDSKGNPLVEVKLNVNNPEEVERVFKEYRVHEQQAEDIRSMIDQYNRGTTEDLTISLYVPNPKARDSQRYYTGYNNKRYYESTVEVGHTSKVLEVAKGNKLGNYLNTTAKASVAFLVDSVMDVITGGTWTIASLFVNIPEDSTGTTTYSHNAALVENKTIKYTYYIENGEEYLGSTVERVQYYFQNLLAVAGQGYVPQKNTPTKTWAASAWNKPDEKAYYHWTIGGYNEQVSGYYYQDTYFNTIAR